MLVKMKLVLSVFVLIFSAIFVVRTVNLDDFAARFYAARYDSSNQGWSGINVVDELLNLFFQYRAAYTINSRYLATIPDEGSVAWLLEALTKVRAMVVAQDIVPHAPIPSADVVVGVGYCDHVNAIAARSIASFVDEAEVFAIENHTIGRVILPGEAGWVYFDIWKDFVTLFRKDFGKPLQLLVSRRVAYNGSEKEIESLIQLYNRSVDFGHTLSRLYSKFLAQLVYRVWKKIRPSEFVPTYPVQEIALVNQSSIEQPMDWVPYNLSDIIPDREAGILYFQARFAIFAGNISKAKGLLTHLREDARSDPYGQKFENLTKAFLQGLDVLI